ncbi:MAG: VOC family protein [Leptospiraceae bacterium]|nr:VOC family protein [Leptospiraceae bacterium]
MSKEKIKPVPKSIPNISCYLTVKNTSKAIEFYVNVFGGKEKGRLTMPDGSIAHAEVKIGDSVVWLADENAEWGNQSPESLNGTPVALALYVKNVDKIFDKALKAGAKELTKVQDQFYGDRSGTLLDPFGHKWMISTQIEIVSFKKMQKRMEKLFGDSEA